MIVKTEEKRPTFLEWLWDRHHTTPTIHKVLCRRTSARRSWWEDYEASMEWYRRRYRYEMDLREQLIKNNPFKED